MKEAPPRRSDPPDDGPEEIDDVDEVSGGNTLDPCIPPTNDPFRDWSDPLGDQRRTQML